MVEFYDLLQKHFLINQSLEQWMIEMKKVGDESENLDENDPDFRQKALSLKRRASRLSEIKKYLLSNIDQWEKEKAEFYAKHRCTPSFKKDPQEQKKALLRHSVRN